MTFADGWVCQACWKSNRPKDPVCYRCKTPRDADDATVEATRAAAEAKVEQPEAVPDVVVAVPVVIFRSYARVWQRGGFVVLGFLVLIAIGGVTDVATTIQAARRLDLASPVAHRSVAGSFACDAGNSAVIPAW